MANLWNCGAECGITGDVAGVDRHLNSKTGTPTIETTIVEPGGGSKAFRFTATGTAVTSRLDLSVNILTGRFYLYVAGSLPVANCTIFRAQNAAGDSLDIRVLTTGSIVAQVNATTSTTLGTVTVNTWNYVDFTYDATTTPGSIKAILNGGTERTVSAALTGTGLTFCRFGVITATTCDVVLDHIRLTDSVTEYPIGPGYVAGFVPTSTGTHSQTAGDFQDDGAANITNGDGSWAKLDELPGNTTDYIAQAVINGSGYVEYVYGTPSLVPRSVEQVLSVTGGTANTQKAQLYDGVSASDMYALTATAAALQTWTKNWASPPSGGSWTAALLAALRIRWGFSGDVTPNPRLTNTLIEAEFAIGGGGGGGSPTAVLLLGGL